MSKSSVTVKSQCNSRYGACKHKCFGHDVTVEHDKASRLIVIDIAYSNATQSVRHITVDDMLFDAIVEAWEAAK